MNTAGHVLHKDSRGIFILGTAQWYSLRWQQEAVQGREWVGAWPPQNEPEWNASSTAYRKNDLGQLAEPLRLNSLI